jgi:NAD(P)H-dependent FMN reductase
MNNPLKLKVILGSTRQGRFGDKAAQWVMDQLKSRTDIAAELLDLRDFPLPFFDEAMTPSSIKEPYTNPAVAKWTSKIAEGDAFIMLTPEYNHGPSAVLKNAIDYVNKEWNKKPVGFVGWGVVGGARAIEQIRGGVIELQMIPVQKAVYIIAPWMLLDGSGGLTPGALNGHAANVTAMVDQLIAAAK